MPPTVMSLLHPQVHFWGAGPSSPVATTHSMCLTPSPLGSCLSQAPGNLTCRSPHRVSVTVPVIVTESPGSSRSQLPPPQPV